MNEEKACDRTAGESPRSQAADPHAADTDSPRILDSEELFAGRQEVLIHHHGELYRLRLTRNDKLILNK